MSVNSHKDHQELSRYLMALAEQKNLDQELKARFANMEHNLNSQEDGDQQMEERQDYKEQQDFTQPYSGQNSPERDEEAKKEIDQAQLTFGNFQINENNSKRIIEKYSNVPIIDEYEQQMPNFSVYSQYQKSKSQEEDDEDEQEEENEDYENNDEDRKKHNKGLRNAGEGSHLNGGNSPNLYSASARGENVKSSMTGNNRMSEVEQQKNYQERINSLYSLLSEQQQSSNSKNSLSGGLFSNRSQISDNQLQGVNDLFIRIYSGLNEQGETQSPESTIQNKTTQHVPERVKDLYDFGKGQLRNQSIQENNLKDQRLKAELAKCTFQPVTNTRNNKYYPSVIENTNIFLQRKREKSQKAEEQKKYNEMQYCTFSPRVNNMRPSSGEYGNSQLPTYEKQLRWLKKVQAQNQQRDQKYFESTFSQAQNSQQKNYNLSTRRNTESYCQNTKSFKGSPNSKSLLITPKQVLNRPQVIWQEQYFSRKQNQSIKSKPNNLLSDQNFTSDQYYVITPRSNANAQKEKSYLFGAEDSRDQNHQYAEPFQDTNRTNKQNNQKNSAIEEEMSETYNLISLMKNMLYLNGSPSDKGNLINSNNNKSATNDLISQEQIAALQVVQNLKNYTEFQSEKRGNHFQEDLSSSEVENKAPNPSYNPNEREKKSQQNSLAPTSKSEKRNSYSSTSTSALTQYLEQKYSLRPETSKNKDQEKQFRIESPQNDLQTANFFASNQQIDVKNNVYVILGEQEAYQKKQEIINEESKEKMNQNNFFSLGNRQNARKSEIRNDEPEVRLFQQNTKQIYQSAIEINQQLKSLKQIF